MTAGERLAIRVEGGPLGTDTTPISWRVSPTNEAPPTVHARKLDYAAPPNPGSRGGPRLGNFSRDGWSRPATHRKTRDTMRRSVTGDPNTP